MPKSETRESHLKIFVLHENPKRFICIKLENEMEKMGTACMNNGTVTGFKNLSLTVSSWLNDSKIELQASKAD